MKWEKKVPTKPGIYLRNNPVTIHVVRQDVFIVNGELCISGLPESPMTVRLSTWHGAKSMWWFGPIPDAPSKRLLIKSEY